MSGRVQWQRSLARLAGADPVQTRVLGEAFDVDRRRRREVAARDGAIPPDAMDLLLALYLFVVGLGMAAVAYHLRVVPGPAAVILLTTNAFLLVAIALPEIFFALLGDEDFRVVACWPVSSAAYLSARLRWLAPRALVVTSLVCGPAALVMMATSGIPVVTGTVFFAYALLASVGLAWTMAGVLALAVTVLGPRLIRFVGLLAQIGAVVGPVAFAALAGRHTETVVSYLVELPLWLPLSWAAGVVEVASGAFTGDIVLRASLGILAALAVPIVAFRAGIRTYTSSLWRARIQRRTGVLGRVVIALARLMRRVLSRPEDTVVWQLMIAHLRFDWRFRSRVLAVPALSGGLIAAAVFGMPATDWFADPFGPKTVLHPSMLFVVLALTPPMLAVAALARSSDHHAAWFMRTGAVADDRFANATARVVRLTFVAPYVLVVGIGYAIAGVHPVSIAAHLVTLGVLGEMTLLATQRVVGGMPFSRANDDDSVDRMIAVGFMLAYILGGLLAFAVVHVMYRWWVGCVVANVLIGLYAVLARPRRGTREALAT